MGVLVPLPICVDFLTYWDKKYSTGTGGLKKLCFFAFKFFAFKRSAGEGFRRIGPAGAALLRDVRL